MIRFTDAALTKMAQRGISREEVAATMSSGSEIVAHSNRRGKLAVFPFNGYRRSKWYAEKEVRVIWVDEPDDVQLVLTAIARYGTFQ